MTDLLIRDVSQQDLDWVKDMTPDGVSQGEFLRGVLAEARSEKIQPQLKCLSSLHACSDTC